jgi:DNA-binding HxlR family transcriptional regulator
MRFGDIVAAVPGISDRMLSERLKELESEGLVTRAVYAEHPVRIEYRLTEKGQDLGAVMDAIAAWAHRWLASSGEPEPAAPASLTIGPGPGSASVGAWREDPEHERSPE